MLLAAWLAVGSIGLAQARSHRPFDARPAGAATDPIPVDALPVEARTTYRLILAGGPFPYPKDGVVFGNRERALPSEPRGFYHEYTVRTPGSRDRGARRIVCGGTLPAHPPSGPAVCYFTADHYAHFRQIAN